MRASGILAAIVLATAASAAQAEDEAFWLGGASYARKPTIRKDVFEFAAEPAIRQVGQDGYEISFEAKDFCDVTVAIVRKGEATQAGCGLPKIVRHLACGVLGPNAPAPLTPDSLVQKIAWDGKDDLHRYVRDPKACAVRVSLGLSPTFDGVYGWHPKGNNGVVEGLAAGPDGVYVVTGDMRTQVRLFDHKGNYVRTVFPPAADVKRADLEGMEFLPLPAGGEALRVFSYGDLLPSGGSLPVQTAGWAAGRLVVGSNGASEPPKVLIRINAATGGPVDGQMVGPALDRRREDLNGGHHIALSPDGRWIYLSQLTSGVGGGSRRFNSVYRVPFDRPGPLPADAFFGEDARADADNQHLNRPLGIATDSRGRVYVADSGNKRIVVLSPEGQFVKAIRQPAPVHVQVNQRTGAIYVLNSEAVGKPGGHLWQPKLLRTVNRLGGLDDPAVKASFTYECPSQPPADNGLFCLDSWADPPTLWVTTITGGLVLFADRGDKFEQVADWRKEVAAAGLIPGMMYGGRMPKVVGDTVRPFVWYHPNGWANARPFRFDLRTGKAERIKLPSPADDIAFDSAGRLYCRAFKCLSRHDADQPGFPEIPFDYGEPVEVGYYKFHGALPLKDMLGAKFYQDGFGVGVDGRMAVLSNYFSLAESLSARRWGFDSKAQYDAFRKEFLQDNRPLPVTPGRNLHNQGTLWVYNAHGQLVGSDLIKGPIAGSIGAGIDKDGAVYMAANYQKIVDGKTFIPQFPTGTLIKATAKGARILGTWKLGDAELTELPDRPADFTINAAAVSEGSRLGSGRVNASSAAVSAGMRLWQTGLEWGYPGVSEHIIATGSCTCPTHRFSLDYFARTFVPEAYRFSVGVVDTNGNLILHVGRYGNADSGRGPDSPVKVGGDELAFSFPSFVSAVDDCLFVSDSGSDRIVRVRLGYHTEKVLDVP